MQPEFLVENECCIVHLVAWHLVYGKTILSFNVLQNLSQRCNGDPG